MPGATEESLLAPTLSSHDVACRANNGPTGGCQRVFSGTVKGRRRDRDVRPAMLLPRPAVLARRLSTRSSLSKSVPCNIIVVAAGPWPATNYLKPKVSPVVPSTRVTGVSEKMLLHTISSVCGVSLRPGRAEKPCAPCSDSEPGDRPGAHLTRQLVYD